MRYVALAFALFAFIATPLRGQSYMWFETENAMGDSSGSAHAGGIGQQLDLQCGNSANACKWTIKLFASIPNGIHGWTADLITATGGPVFLAASDGVVGTNNPFTGPFSLAQFGVGGTGASLFTGARGQTFEPPPAGVYHLLSFSLIKPAGTAGSTYSVDIMGRIPSNGPVVWANAQGEMEQVGYGPNPLARLVDGGVYTAPLPVIRVNVVPEAGTITLLAVFGCVLFRRPRAEGNG